jgi:O-antigen ligase
MDAFITGIDNTAGIEAATPLAAWLERLAFVFLVLMVLAAPHSIAVTQTAWILGMIFWIARFFLRPRPKLRWTFLAAPIFTLFGWTIISAIFSYAPDISFGKLKSAALFLIFFFAFNNLRTGKSARLLASALIVSCMVSVLWMPLERVIGRGVKIQNVDVEGPLYKAGFHEGDSIFAAEGKRVNNPADIIETIETRGKAEIKYYRNGHYWQFDVTKESLLQGSTPLEKLGVGSWSKSRSWRSSGFYGHYATYAEVLLLIGSLTLGILVACFGTPARKLGGAQSHPVSSLENPRKPTIYVSWISVLLFFCVAMISVALVLTITRASQGSFVIAAFLMVLFGGGRRLLIALTVISIPVVAAGLIFLQQTRGMDSIDSSDESASWRQTVYREGFELWTKNPRNFIVGVGMDSIKRYKDDWKLFDNGRLPTGHFHSTPLQLLVERGLPALLLWLWLFGLYVLKLFRFVRLNAFSNWQEKGIVLGAFGGVCGFLISSTVHYNYGDGEVVMVLYLIMAMAITIVSANPHNKREAVQDHS